MYNIYSIVIDYFSLDYISILNHIECIMYTISYRLHTLYTCHWLQHRDWSTHWLIDWLTAYVKEYYTIYYVIKHYTIYHVYKVCLLNTISLLMPHSCTNWLTAYSLKVTPLINFFWYHDSLIDKIDYACFIMVIKSYF